MQQQAVQQIHAKLDKSLRVLQNKQCHSNKALLTIQPLSRLFFPLSNDNNCQ